MISKIKKMFSEGPFKKLFKNTGLLISGDTVSAVLGVLTFAVTARALGTEALGMLVLVDAYVRIVDKLVNFQSWQFMIKYGSDALEGKDPAGFKALIKFGTLVDGFTALLGCAVAVAGAGLIGKWQNWSQEMVQCAVIYSAIVAFDVAGVPTGILRIFDKFKLFSVQKSICATIKFAGAALAWALGYGFKGFLWVWMLTEIVDYVSLTVMAWAELHKRGYKGIWAEPLKGITQRYPGIWNFMISTNLTGSVKVGFRELDILIVGKYLGLTDVSLYKLAKKICASLDRLTNPLYQSLYPELTRLWAKRDFRNFRRMVKQMIYIMGGLSLVTWLCFVIWGRSIIDLAVGHEFVAAYAVTVWYLLANGIAITSLPLSPMILAMGYANLSFWIQFLPTLVYFPVLYWLIMSWGLAGAGYAYIVYHSLRLVLQYFMVRNLLRSVPREAAPAVVLDVQTEEDPSSLAE
jgi:O-antigen/teichoic acid export membrane protein